MAKLGKPKTKGKLFKVGRRKMWSARDQKANPKRLIVREKREAAGLILGAIAKHLGMGVHQYSRLELNPERFKAKHYQVLAQLFSCSVNDLVEPGDVEVNPVASTRRTVPVYDVSNGTMDRIGELAPSFEVGGNAYAIEVPNDAMAVGPGKVLPAGCWAIIDPGKTPKPGDIVHALDPDTGEHILRQYTPLHPSNARAPGAMLRAYSKTVDEIYVSAKQAKAIKGVVVGKQEQF
jgi:SOS-response transcriptional repressor LexA